MMIITMIIQLCTLQTHQTANDDHDDVDHNDDDNFDHDDDDAMKLKIMIFLKMSMHISNQKIALSMQIF